MKQVFKTSKKGILLRITWGLAFGRGQKAGRGGGGLCLSLQLDRPTGVGKVLLSRAPTQGRHEKEMWQHDWMLVSHENTRIQPAGCVVQPYHLSTVYGYFCSFHCGNDYVDWKTRIFTIQPFKKEIAHVKECSLH